MISRRFAGVYRQFTLRPVRLISTSLFSSSLTHFPSVAPIPDHDTPWTDSRPATENDDLMTAGVHGLGENGADVTGPTSNNQFHGLIRKRVY